MSVLLTYFYSSPPSLRFGPNQPFIVSDCAAVQLHKTGHSLQVRNQTISELAKRGTLPTFAGAAIAIAAFLRSCGKLFAGRQPMSLNRPLESIMRHRIRTVLSPLGVGVGKELPAPHKRQQFAYNGFTFLHSMSLPVFCLCVGPTASFFKRCIPVGKAHC